MWVAAPRLAGPWGCSLSSVEDDVTGGQWLLALGAGALVALGLTAALGWWLLGV